MIRATLFILENALLTRITFLHLGGRRQNRVVMMEELEKLFIKLFDSHFKFEPEEGTLPEEGTETSLSIPTQKFRRWLDRHVQEQQLIDIEDQKEDFEKIRMICCYCKERITDDKFFVIHHPDFPTDLTKMLYFHTQGECNPRLQLVQLSRQLWLERYRKKPIFCSSSRILRNKLSIKYNRR